MAYNGSEFDIPPAIFFSVHQSCRYISFGVPGGEAGWVDSINHGLMYQGQVDIGYGPVPPTWGVGKGIEKPGPGIDFRQNDLFILIHKKGRLPFCSSWGLANPGKESFGELFKFLLYRFGAWSDSGS